MSSEQWIAAKPSPQVDEIAKRFVDLSHPRLGSKAISCSDEFFAPMDRILSPQSPIFVPDKYDDNGKWMDGWESRRKRVAGHDWCIIKLGAPGRIYAFDIETSHFTGNFPPAASIEAWSGDGEPDENTEWQTLVPQMDLQGDSHHLVEIENGEVWKYLRLNIFPDGGVARLRIFGEIFKNWDAVSKSEMVDLAAQVNGGTAIIWNDAHFGVPSNMIAPGRGINMGDGWETARRRIPGNDWSVLKLGHAGIVENLVVDTKFFKGNFPDRCSIRAKLLEGDVSNDELEAQSENWPILLPEVKLSADAEHGFSDELVKLGPISHLRLDIFPDGGVSRLRLFGKKA